MTRPRRGLLRELAAGEQQVDAEFGDALADPFVHARRILTELRHAPEHDDTALGRLLCERVEGGERSAHRRVVGVVDDRHPVEGVPLVPSVRQCERRDARRDVGRRDAEREDARGGGRRVDQVVVARDARVDALVVGARPFEETEGRPVAQDHRGCVGRRDERSRSRRTAAARAASFRGAAT